MRDPLGAGTLQRSDADDCCRPAARTPHVTSQPSTPVRVAVADDNEDLCLVLGELIHESEGLACVARITVREEVLKCVAACQPDVLVLDLMLGGENSLSLLPELAARSPGTRVLIHSGYKLDALAVDVTRRGAVAYIAKGGDPDELIEAIKRIAHEPR